MIENVRRDAREMAGGADRGRDQKHRRTDSFQQLEKVQKEASRRDLKFSGYHCEHLSWGL